MPTVRKALCFGLAFAVMVGMAYPANSASVISIASNDSDIAILFVHGLDGHPIDSFKSESPPISWPDIIKSDERVLANNHSLKDFDIFSLDYSDVFAEGGVDISVEEMVQQVDNAIRAHSLFKDHNHIWIVAHSLGGIVTKRLMIKWKGTGLTRYLDRIAGVFLLGVPSNGAPLADLATDDNYLELVTGWLGYNVTHVNDLKTIGNMNTFLRSVENDWANLISGRGQSRLPLVLCGYETIAEIKIGWAKVKVVPEIYTKTACDGENYPINKSHIQLPKPNDANDPIEDWLYNGIAQSLSLLDQYGESLESANQVGALWSLVHHLQTGHALQTKSPGIRAVDENVMISDGDFESLRSFRLSDSRYAGATWADVFERIASKNRCLIVRIKDSRRRDIEISLNNPLQCPGQSAYRNALTCDQRNCQ